VRRYSLSRFQVGQKPLPPQELGDVLAVVVAMGSRQTKQDGNESRR